MNCFWGDKAQLVFLFGGPDHRTPGETVTGLEGQLLKPLLAIFRNPWGRDRGPEACEFGGSGPDRGCKSGDHGWLESLLQQKWN